jgi:hypothetical protein
MDDVVVEQHDLSSGLRILTRGLGLWLGGEPFDRVVG